jgi:prevent-host-death family protein
MYMTTLPVADARAQFSKLVEDAERTHQRYEITRNGHRAAVLLGADDYDALQETIAVLSDPALLAEHRQAEAEIEAGDYVSADELTEAMRAAGRLPA